jgi:hypothetical protein
MELVLEDATVEIATHANVESAGDASHDVGAVVAGGLGALGYRLTIWVGFAVMDVTEWRVVPRMGLLKG